MSSTIAVYGIKPADDKYNKMLSVYESCMKAGVNIPDEVYDFFGGEPPNGIGVECDIEVNESREDYCTYLDVNVDNLPKDVKIIRVYRS